MDDRCRHLPDDRPRPMQKSFSATARLHLDEDESRTLRVERNIAQPLEGTQRCEVCDRLALGTHYGAVVCGSCACKSYQCTCRMPYRTKNKGCRHCRFKNCLKAGMDAEVVQVIRLFPQSNNTLLSRLLACRNHVYVSRGLFLRETDAEREKNPRWRLPDLGRGRSFQFLCHVEGNALTQYWTDFSQCFANFKDGASPTVLTKHFLAVWLKLEQILASVSHGSIDKETCMSDYETTVPVTYDWFYAMCRRHTIWARDPAATAALALENTSEVLHLSQIVRRASLDNFEVTALIQLLVAYYEKEMFVDEDSVKNFVNQVLRELHDHYKSTYHSYHERLGVLASIVGEFHRMMCLHEQFSTQMSLYTNRGQGWQPPQREPVDTLHDLRHSVKL